MKDLRGKTAILTGANGGLGSYLADALAAEGVNLFLVGFIHPGLDVLAARAVAQGVRAGVMVADLREPAARESVIAAALRELGPVDLLINNAGVEYSSAFHELNEAQIQEVLGVNLTAPMMLTRRLLPEMVKRRSGHIVNISSLAGKSGPAFQEPYAATKAALVAFTFSLRASYQGTGVSASAVTPGFVEAGIYARLKARTGCTAPRLLGAVKPERVARSVIRAIRDDVPEIIVSRYPVQPILMVLALAPRLGLWLISMLGTHRFFRQVVDAGRPGRT